MVTFPVIQILPQIPDFEWIYCSCSDSLASSDKKYSCYLYLILGSWRKRPAQKREEEERKGKRKGKKLYKSPPYSFLKGKSGTGFMFQSEKKTKKVGQKYGIMGFKTLDMNIRPWRIVIPERWGNEVSLFYLEVYNMWCNKVEYSQSPVEMS